MRDLRAGYEDPGATEIVQTPNKPVIVAGHGMDCLRRRRGLVRRTSLIAALAAMATLFPGAATGAASPAALVNPCGSAPATAQFGATNNRVGLIDLYYFNPQGRPVTFVECEDRRPRFLGELSSSSDRAVLLGAATWDCDRTTRYFAATTTQLLGHVELGTASVQTPSCAHRFALDAPKTLKRGRVAHIGVTDRWHQGDLKTRVCVRSPAGKRSCRDVAFAAGVDFAEARFRLRGRGRWRVELQVREFRVRDAIAVGGGRVKPRKALPTVLATGDSTMGSVASALSDELGDENSVVTDVRPGLKLSGPNDWAAIAASQAGMVRPDVTVLSIGANEGLPQVAAGRVHNCCDAGWSAEYQQRMKATMHTYARGGAGRVFVMTIPAPRDPRRAAITATVNAAIVRAGEALGVTVLRMDLLFSPNGYQEVIRNDDEDIAVREADGVHLNVAGAKIAAHIAAQAIRAPQP